MELTIRVEGLEPFTAAVTRLAEAIENQEKVVVPEEVNVNISNPEAYAEAVEKTAKKPARKSAAKSSGKKATLDDVRSKARQLAQKGFKNELKALLAEYEVSNVSALDESVLDEVMAKLEELG